MINPIGGEFNVVLLEPKAQSVVAVMSNLSKEGQLPGLVLGRTQSGQMEVRIGDRVITVETNVPLAPGTTFTARIAGNSLVLHPDPDSVNYSLFRRAFDPANRNPSVEVAIRSLETSLRDVGIAPDKTWLTLSEAVISAGLPLSAGLLRRLRRTFGEVSDRDLSAVSLMLKKDVPFTARIFDTIKQILASNEKISDLLDEIEDLLKQILGRSPNEDLKKAVERLSGLKRTVENPECDGDEVKQKIQNSGVFAEARIFSGKDVSNDLKCLLAEVLRSVRNSIDAEEGASDLLRTLAEKVDKSLEAISKNQLRSLDDPRENESIRYVEIPLRFENEETRVEFMVRRDAGSPEEKPCCSIGFRLTLSVMGETYGLVRQIGDRLQVILYVESEESLGRIRSHGDELTSALAAVGFGAVGLDASALPEVDGDLFGDLSNR